MARAPLTARVRAALLPTACVLLAGYFAYHAIASDTGLLAWGGIRAEHAQLAARATQVTAERDRLRHRVDLLDPAHVDADLADELVRRDLDVVRPDEVVVPLPAGD